MPRTALSALLRELKAHGVTRYRKGKGFVELEFSGATPRAAVEPEDPELARELREAAKADAKKDPLRVALDEFPPVEGEDDEVEAN
jgi:hypothetical protein